jgi:hypothetical protein
MIALSAMAAGGDVGAGLLPCVADAGGGAMVAA